MFLWNLQTIDSAFEKLLPEMQQKFAEGETLYNTDKEQEFINDAFPSCHNISIDYGIMISAYYFHRLFKKETGHTPKDYTKQRQMQEAYKTLSTNRQIEIQDIWIQLGYTSSSHFAKDFREYFGCNPSELKRNADHAKKSLSISN